MRDMLFWVETCQGSTVLLGACYEYLRTRAAQCRVIRPGNVWLNYNTKTLAETMEGVRRE